MPKRNLPQPFEIDKMRFVGCSTAPSMRHFAVLITGWVLTVRVHAISQVILSGALHESEHFVSLYRFLARAKWSPDQVAFRVFRMIVDGGYSNRQIIQGRPKRVHITGKVRTDAALYALATQHTGKKRGRPRKKGERLPTPGSLFSYWGPQWEWIWIALYGQETIVSAHHFQAIWYKAAGNEPLAIVMVRDPAGKYPDTVFFDTDTTASDEQIIQRFTHRWSIEITNRETKSLLGSADDQCRLETSVTRAPLMAYWSYCFVVVWFVGQFRMGKNLLIPSAPWYAKRSITFSDMLAVARRTHYTTGISREPRKRPSTPKTIPTRFTSRPEAWQRAKP